MIVNLCFSMQGEDVIEYANDKCVCIIGMCLHFLVCKRNICLSILMPSDVCVHFSHLINHVVI